MDLSKNSNWKIENEKKDVYYLVIDNIKFARHRSNKDGSINWRCDIANNFNCKASVTIINEKVTYFVGHDSVEHFILTEIDYTKKDFINKVKSRVINQSSTPAKQIYDSELVELVKSTSLIMKDIEYNIPFKHGWVR